MLRGIVIGFIVMFNCCCFAAEKCDEGLTFNGFSGKTTCGQTLISPKELPDLLKQDSEAYKVFLKGRNLSKAGMAPSTIGGFALGWGIGVSLFNGPLKPSAGPAFIIGAIGLSIGLPITIAGISKTKQAVEIYNENVKTSFIVPSFQFSGNSISAVWDF